MQAEARGTGRADPAIRLRQGSLPPGTYFSPGPGGLITPEMDFFADQGDAFPLIPLDKGFWWERGKGVRDIID